MEINGKALQKELLEDLKIKIANLKASGVVPGIAIVTLGPEVTWEAYVGQKIKLAKELGVEAKLINLNPQNTEDVLEAVKKLNTDNTIHGLIVQRPFPTHIDTEKVIQSVSKEKDIDGFRNDSLFEVPVFLAVMFIIKQVSLLLKVPNYQFWLSNQSILIVGKGETAGHPTIAGLQKLGISPLVMDRSTTNSDQLYQEADIIIFGTGNRLTVPYDKLKKNCILIGIGLHRSEGQLQGDFDHFEAKKYGLYYTPSPGGVGPLNLYFLFDNLVEAAKTRTQNKARVEFSNISE